MSLKSHFIDLAKQNKTATKKKENRGKENPKCLEYIIK